MVKGIMHRIDLPHPFHVPFERVLVVEREAGLKNVQPRPCHHGGLTPLSLLPSGAPGAAE